MIPTGTRRNAQAIDLYWRDREDVTYDDLWWMCHMMAALLKECEAYRDALRPADAPEQGRMA